MRIGILGSGLMGAKLGTLFARSGHQVAFSYSATPGKLERLAQAAGPGARAASPAGAARDAEAVLFAVHWSRTDDVLAQAGDLSGRVVITCALPMGADDAGLVVAHTSSGAEELAKRLPDATVVSAFGTIPSEVLFSVFAARDAGAPPDLLYCGDDEDAKRRVAGLIRDLGFAPVDAGPLRAARWLEPFTLLIARLAYDTGESPALAYRFERRQELADPALE